MLKAAAACFGVIAAVAATGLAATDQTGTGGTAVQPVLQQQTTSKSVAESCKQGLTAAAATDKATSVTAINGDINANGMLDFDDVVKINDAVKDFVKFDLNKDGAIDKADVEIAYNGIDNGSNISMDFNGNGLKDFDDVVKLNDAISAMKQYDFNKDGKLNSNDVNAAYDAVGGSSSNSKTQQQTKSAASQYTAQTKSAVSLTTAQQTKSTAASTSQSTVKGDVNGNGKLDFDDIVRMKDAVKEFKKYDLNKDGTITMDDVKVAFDAVGNKSSKVKMDFNKNGRKDFGDVTKLYDAMKEVSKYDFNGDGKFDMKDIKAAYKLL
jgi:Ca2+-binding EF-hand superfamily protein